MLRPFILPVLLLLALVSCPGGFAQVSDPIGVASLSGLTGFCVSAGESNRQAESAKLPPDQLRDDAVATLRAAGIGLVPASAWLDSAGAAELYLEADMLGHGANQFSFALRVSVIQKVSLQTKADRQTLAATWSKSSMGIAGSLNAASIIREQMGILVKQFIDSYRAANPPPKKE
jgi:hypothetical protein